MHRSTHTQSFNVVVWWALGLCSKRQKSPAPEVPSPQGTKLSEVLNSLRYLLPLRKTEHFCMTYLYPATYLKLYVLPYLALCIGYISAYSAPFREWRGKVYKAQNRYSFGFLPIFSTSEGQPHNITNRTFPRYLKEQNLSKLEDKWRFTGSGRKGRGACVQSARWKVLSFCFWTQRYCTEHF